METNIRFPEQVILLDADFLHETISDIHRILSEKLGRTLPPLDVASWLTCLLLDAGVRGTGNEVQAIVAGSRHNTAWPCCLPGKPAEIDGQACRTALGELSFSVVSAEGLAATDALYSDLTGLVLNDPAVKTLLLVSARSNEALDATLQQLQKTLGTWNCHVYACTLQMSGRQLLCEQLPITYSLAHAWGIRADELI